jgi:hypothetical protein
MTFYTELKTPAKGSSLIAIVKHGNTTTRLDQPNSVYILSHWRSLPEAEAAAKAWAQKMGTSADSYQNDGKGATHRKAWRWNPKTGKVTCTRY